MEAKNILNHIHAAWVLKKFGYKARRVKNNNGIYNRIQVEKDHGSTVSFIYMRLDAVVNMARTLVETRGKLENIRNKR